MLRWWLLPSWSRTSDIKYATFNAKSEEAATKPAFRAPFRRWRCVVPVSGFYEWRRDGAEKQPYYITRADRTILYLAGLWDRWESPEGNATIESCTILTTAPSAEMKRVHHRMPCILEPEHIEGWVDPDLSELDEIQSFLAPSPDGLLVMHKVDRRVGNARLHNDAGLIAHAS